MQSVISDHLKNEAANDYALISPIHFVYSPWGTISYNYKIYVYETYNEITIALGNNKFTFTIDNHYGNKIKVIKVSGSDGDRSIILGNSISFNFNYYSTENTIYVIDDVIGYQTKHYATDHIKFTRDGKVNKISTIYLSYEDGNDFIEPANTYTFFKKNITEFIKRGLNDPLIITRAYAQVKIFISFYPNGQLERYGVMIDNVKKGIFYDSDESGKIRVSNYVDDILHGYYFDSFTDEQGFYNKGIKVGFWEEQGRLVNYDGKNMIYGRINDIAKDRIFFLFPVFFL